MIIHDYDLSYREGDENWDCEGCGRTYDGLFDKAPQLEIHDGKAHMYYCGLCVEDGRVAPSPSSLRIPRPTQDGMDGTLPERAIDVGASKASLAEAGDGKEPQVGAGPSREILPANVIDPRELFSADIYRAQTDRQWIMALAVLILVCGVTAICEALK